jgi:nucleotide-binding universal stress UspA family protein
MAGNDKQLHRILLAVDGSEHALAATRLLASLPCSRESQVHIITVMLPRRGQYHFPLDVALEEARAVLEEHGIQAEGEMPTGYPAQIIVDYADRIEPDLIVMGARGLRATLGILLGGVAQQVVEYARWPVLVVRAPYQRLRKVAVATDGSPYSERALDFLGCFQLEQGTALELLHVLPPIPSPEVIARAWPTDVVVGSTFSLRELEINFQRQAELEEQDGRRLLGVTQERLAAMGLEVRPVLLRGDAATEMIQYIQEDNIDLVIVGSRGLGQVRGWLLGSVSRKLLHYAGCSVLVVKNGEDTKGG